MKTAFLLPALCCALLTANLTAATPDELRAEADKLAEKARLAKSEGRPDEAVELMNQSKKIQAELREKTAGDEPANKGDAKLQRIKKGIDELHGAGKHEEAERLKRQLAEAQQGTPEGGKAVPQAEGAERVAHVMEAVKHLRVAGLNEPAQHLEQLARKMREELERRSESADGAGTGQMEAALREMRERMEKMQREIEELRKQAAKNRREADKG